MVHLNLEVLGYQRDQAYLGVLILLLVLRLLLLLFLLSLQLNHLVQFLLELLELQWYLLLQ